MVKGTTSTGFKYEIADGVAQDYEFIECILVADNKNANEMDRLRATMKMCEIILGKNKDALLEHIRKNNNGIASIEMVSAEVAEIIEESNTLKN